MGEAARLAAIVSLAFRSSLRGLRLVGLAAFAAVPTLLVVALASAHTATAALEGAAEGLLGSITMPIVVMVVVLVLAVGQFRNEIDAETLVYLSGRSVRRATVVVGKYLGTLAASLALALPAGLLPLGVVSLAGGHPTSESVVPVFAATLALASAAYVGVFLFLGLVSRSALIVGLLFGFLWEELLVLLPGDAPRLTLAYYLRSVLAGSLTSGPLASYPNAVTPTVAVSALGGVTVVFVVLAAVAFRHLETAPERGSI